ncbi:MAG: hypothetical protein R3F11_19725 [Verrucomicrobiales bacterium]
MGGLPDPRNARICAQRTADSSSCTPSASQGRHTHQSYADVLGAMEAFFAEKIAAPPPPDCRRGDPHLTRDSARRQPRRAPPPRGASTPSAAPSSPDLRKTVIGDVLDIADPPNATAGTIGHSPCGIAQSAQIFRVHHVEAAAQSARCSGRWNAAARARHEIARPSPLCGKKCGFADW